MAALLVTSSIGATFTVASGLGFVGPVLALIASFYFDLPAGPACAALLALGVAVAAIATVYTGGRKPLLRFVRQPQAGTARI
jgi:ABC-type Mn2+/Zn2+ transport system permease subunit